MRTLANEAVFDYKVYQYTYRAASTLSLLMFMMSHPKNYWCLDDISVTKLNNTDILIGNTGFESGDLAPYTLYSVSTKGPTGLVHLGYAKTGSYSFIDGMNEEYDVLWQTFVTVPQQDYVITFSVRNLGPAPNELVALVAAVNTTREIFSSFIFQPSHIRLFFRTNNSCFNNNNNNSEAHNK